jgi:hypothetical protein
MSAMGMGPSSVRITVSPRTQPTAPTMKEMNFSDVKNASVLGTGVKIRLMG